MGANQRVNSGVTSANKIYEEGDLIKDPLGFYNRDIDEVLIEGERGYKTANDFMKMIMPIPRMLNTTTTVCLFLRDIRWKVF